MDCSLHIDSKPLTVALFTVDSPNPTLIIQFRVLLYRFHE